MCIRDRYRTQFEPSVLSTGEISEEQIRAFFEELSELMDVADWSDYYPVVRASLYPGNYMVNPQLSCAEIFFDEIDAASDYVADLSSLQTVYSCLLYTSLSQKLPPSSARIILR